MRKFEKVGLLCLLLGIGAAGQTNGTIMLCGGIWYGAVVFGLGTGAVTFAVGGIIRTVVKLEYPNGKTLAGNRENRK